MDIRDPHIIKNTNYLKEYFKKKTTLVIAISYGLSILLSLASMITALLPSALRSLRALTGEYVYGATGNFAPSQLVQLATLPMLILPFLSFLGFLLLYIKSKNSSPASSPKGGAAVLKAVGTISLVLGIFETFVLLLIPILFAFMPYATSKLYRFDFPYDTFSQNPEAAPIVMGAIFAGIVFLIVAPFIVYLLLSVIFEFRFFSSLRKSLVTSNLTAKGSVGFGVMNIISCVFTTLVTGTSILLYVLNTAFGIRGILPLRNTSLGTASSFTSIVSIIILVLSLALSLVSGIAIAKFAFGYNKHIKSVPENFHDTPKPYYYREKVTYAPAEEPVFMGNAYAGLTSQNNEAKAEASEKPVVVAETPVEVTETPVETVEAPIEVTETPVETAKITEDTSDAKNETVCINLSELTPEARSIVEDALKNIQGKDE